MFNEHNQKYIDAMAAALKAPADQVVNGMVTAFHARHRLAEITGSVDHVLLAFAREGALDAPLMAGHDLYVYLQTVYRQELAQLEAKITPRAQEKIEELEKIVVAQQRRIDALLLMRKLKISEKKAEAMVDKNPPGRVSPEDAARIAAAPPPKLPDGTGCVMEGESKEIADRLATANWLLSMRKPEGEK